MQIISGMLLMSTLAASKNNLADLQLFYFSACCSDIEVWTLSAAAEHTSASTYHGETEVQQK